MAKLFPLPPLRVALVYLMLLAGFAVGVKLDLNYYVMRAVSLTALSFGFLIIPAIKHKAGALKYPFLTNNLISIFILFLILDEFLPWWQFVAFGAMASAIKHFVRLNRLPIFNPAAAGIVLAVALGALETWWGASFSPRFTSLEISGAVILTVPFGLYLAHKYKKWGASLSFLATYAVLMTVWLGMLPTYQILEGTMLFFALIMVSEPKTSPNLLWQQVIFGTAVGVLSVLALMRGIASPYATALIMGNLGFRLYVWWQQKQRLSKATDSAPPVVTA